MNITHNVVGWFEIPVANMDRAIQFYETVFGYSLDKHQIGSAVMAWFPFLETEIGSPGALIQQDEHYRPSATGTLLYFTAFSGDLANELSRVEGAGGKVEIPKREISPEIGFMAVFIDSGMTSRPAWS